MAGNEESCKKQPRQQKTMVEWRKGKEQRDQQPFALLVLLVQELGVIWAAAGYLGVASCPGLWLWEDGAPLPCEGKARFEGKEQHGR
jgi:hypothetical protein